MQMTGAGARTKDGLFAFACVKNSEDRMGIVAYENYMTCVGADRGELAAGDIVLRHQSRDHGVNSSWHKR